MKSRFLKVLLAVFVLFACIPMTVIKTEAAETITIYVYPGTEYHFELKMNKGDTLMDGFKAHPEVYKQVCLGNPSETTVRFYTTSGFEPFSIVHPRQTFTKDTIVYSEYHQAINEVRLGMQWPTAGTSSSGYSLKTMDKNAHYSPYIDVWNNGYSNVTFQEGKTYKATFAFTMEGNYEVAILNPDLKVYLNGVLMKDPYLVLSGVSHGDSPIYEIGGNFVFTADRKVSQFVKRMYQLCLGRNPDTNGFNNWVTNLMTKTKTAAEVAYGFFNSKELQSKNLNDEAFVNLCYSVMFDRSPDAGGKKNWLDKLTNGVSRNYVLNGFVGSVEFNNLCAKYGITPGKIKLTEARDQNYNLTSFIARMYRLVLGRKFDVPGMNNWCKKVLDAKDRRSAIIDMAFGFFHSAEFAKMNTDNKTYVTILYAVFFDRAPDTGGLNDWLKKLSAGMSRDNVLLGFANSPEFTNLLKKYKLL